jgi:uncharacterized protein with GYD domain
MPTFVTLAKWTDEGIRNIKDSPKRRQAFEDRITSMGGKVKDAYLVMGEYDLVVVTDVPDDETAAKMALGTAMQGNVRTIDDAGIRPGGDGQDLRKPAVGRRTCDAQTARQNKPPPFRPSTQGLERVAVGSIRE